jgi:hypothetical protein
MPRQAAVLIGCNRTAVDFDRLIAVGDRAVATGAGDSPASLRPTNQVPRLGLRERLA